MTVDLISATLKWPGWENCLASWQANHLGAATRLLENDLTGFTLLQSYNWAWTHSSADILGYVHDDLVCFDSLWLHRVKQEFLDPTVGVVGFAGAFGHGAPDLYANGFVLPKLARQDFLSNMRDAEKHGRRFGGSCDVAVLDGMALFVRSSLLNKLKGWDERFGYYMYSEWLCCSARRLGYKVRMVGVAVDHLGGKSTGLSKVEKFDFEGTHKLLWEEFRDVLPYRVEVSE